MIKYSLGEVRFLFVLTNFTNSSAVGSEKMITRMKVNYVRVPISTIFP